jgi:transaldolase
VVKLFADGADLKTMAAQAAEGEISGFTTNPALLRKSGIKDYAQFAQAVLALVHGLPVSFEVLSDDIKGIEREARQIAKWGPNVWVKVPITTSSGETCSSVIKSLSEEGITVNVTAVMSKGQIKDAVDALGEHGVVSVFAGRIADTGRDPVRMMHSAKSRIRGKNIKLLWASPRQVFDICLATEAGCDIITLTPELLAKRKLFGKSLEDFSLETVRQFYKDAEGITL